ncbi:30S ribosomal protein S20 [Candidatus Wolfebacteria bacterium RIFCSPHIGHO2_01_FULL_48_22]|uniref:Small ribosomal subunit protein bS20 n=2 Tax=Candidatus Wolfeibacteriota TaxID=1752735 RepID=A0A1F8DPP4_9BACT|nr:MAG: 30S ribosomal protein S20 [Candidatus Wolfebacteria bacterium RIFCSPHIGHO2_01_FULL_48_22]OGM92097.1 MAG: 30S ribosomal protein S20 [Candidatus Wolfebacteria bacterium RIFCSPLOWO2_01_FULL_47_17b]
MPNTKSAIKANRQNIRRRERNLERKTALKSAAKEFKKLAAAQKKDEAAAALTKLYKTADKTSKSNFIHRNKASRIKSRASRLYTKTFTKA